MIVLGELCIPIKGGWGRGGIVTFEFKNFGHGFFLESYQ